ncbi:MAG TPA: ECF-type sigma factor [Tahibacter sp.]|uniref:ECF-type sigma factor n=1 Tax=Tahibacter sp. TaxID=2056211 RepID=UPI002BC8E779|nr:ECF-type sigma factor [Tahibacter sp.]HSX61337.1 ECF-type sigma factor [Tahibacter sp.]
MSSPPAPPPNADALFGEVYDRLKRMAHRELGRAGGGTVSTTELVHDLYLRVSRGDELAFSDPAQFFAYAARAMRHILVDRARQRLRLKAGGDQVRLSLTDPAVEAVTLGPQQALQLDSALDALARDDARAAQVVELHYFGGLTLDRVAELLGVVPRTVDRDWRYARAFLLAQME